jgi:chorismate mutase
MADQRDVDARNETPPEVEGLRRRIDVIDDQLMKLLNSRSACAVEIGRLKRHLGMAVYQPGREVWILERAAANNPGPLDGGAVRRVFERIIDESRRLERLAQDGAKQDTGGAGTALPPDKEGD